jgi:ATP-dependent helicase/nuclease subunit A
MESKNFKAVRISRQSQIQMEPSRERNLLTPSQRRAVAARGNVLVMAGAGTGKTHTLVERCLDCLLDERAALDEILVVTFTEAAAAEMRLRLRAALERTINSQPPGATRQSQDGPAFTQFCAEQLALFDAAHIGTLHSFCFKLVREHFYELGLDPQLAVLDEGEARLLAAETLDSQFESNYEVGDEFSEAVRNLIQIYGGGRDEKIRALVLRLHEYSQTRPDAEGWLARQIGRFSASDPAEWRSLLHRAIGDWRDGWLPPLKSLSANEKAAELAQILLGLPENGSRETAAKILEQIVCADTNWPARRKTALRQPLEGLFYEAEFLLSLTVVKNGNDPLAEDWDWVRGHMATLLRLAQEFTGNFSERKRMEGVLDFHDLEQFTLKLLWDFSADKPTAIARRWRERLRFIFVDEYQDINAAQDKIIGALSREGADADRFLVGDVKQSIYRFRLADPEIFRRYAINWRKPDGQTIRLSENFRSRESLLHLVNSIFGLLMREDIGGVRYDTEAHLKFGLPDARAQFSVAKDSSPRAEMLLRLKKGRGEVPGDEDSDLADLNETEKEARLLALRLKELVGSRHEIWDDKRKSFRAVEWRDMAVLLRSPKGKSEVFAKQFERAGAPLLVARGGFFDSREILDLLSLLQLLDNPLQDVPVIAVLRSPLVGCSVDELAEIRLAAADVHFWTALNRMRTAECRVPSELRQKIDRFLDRFARWRKLARQASLSQCLEDILVETRYADWLRAQPRGAQRHAKVSQFLNLAQKFDQFQRQGLFQFLKFIEAQREAEAEPEVAPFAEENAVRLMSIHQSKGLEFPVVALADLAKPFNLQDLRDEIILDEKFGLCPRIAPPGSGSRYPGLTHWLAQRRQRRELLGEELRLLYVAMTRARDLLILTASVSEKDWNEKWTQPEAVTAREIAGARSCADWLGSWFGAQSPKFNAQIPVEGEMPYLRWRIAGDAELSIQPVSGARPSPMEMPALDATTVERLRSLLSWKYPHEAATRRAAKSSVTALRRGAEEADDEAEKVFSTVGFHNATKRPVKSPPSSLLAPHLSAAQIGVAHHKFLQHAALERLAGVAALDAESRRLEAEKFLSAEERAALDLKALADFWNSPPGRQIRERAGFVKRELPFTARFSAVELDGIFGTKSPHLEGEFVVVQGVADLAVLLPEEIWLLDFKTDEVRANELAEKTKTYAPQLKLYAAALGKIYSRPVTKCWLHFLSARKTVDVKI